MTSTQAEGSAINPNVNCLEGKRCPSCGSCGPFEILVLIRVLLYDSGTDDARDGAVEYDGKAPTECCACGHEGTFASFDE